MVLSWSIVPFEFMVKLGLYSFGGIILLLAPILMYDKLSQHFTSASKLKLSLSISIAFLIIPICLHAIYWAKLHAFKNNIYGNNEMVIAFDRSEDLIINNHVGNEWGVNALINDNKCKEKEAILINGSEPLTITTNVIESDSISDEGSATTIVEITPDFLYGDEAVIQTIRVVEGNGRYRGNHATWEIKYKFNRIYSFWDVVLS